jgi:hypothetical protein
MTSCDQDHDRLFVFPAFHEQRMVFAIGNNLEKGVSVGAAGEQRVCAFAPLIVLAVIEVTCALDVSATPDRVWKDAMVTWASASVHADPRMRAPQAVHGAPDRSERGVC